MLKKIRFHFLLAGPAGLFALMLLLAGCGDDDRPDCAAVLCVADETIQLEFLMDGKNPLADGTYEESDIAVSGKTEEPIDFALLPGSPVLLSVNSPEWEPGEYFYTIELGADWSVPVSVRFTKPKSNDPCCEDPLEILNLESAGFRTEKRISYYTVFLN